MSDLSGIYSLRGFLYQMKIYELFVLEHAWEDDDYLTYEGLDDIEFGTTYLISSKEKFVQIKSGSCDKTVYYSVLSNWFVLNKEYSSSNFLLIYENGDTDNYKSDNFFKDYYSYIASESKLHPGGKHAKALKLYSSKEEMAAAFTNLNQRISYKQIVEEEIYSLLLEETRKKSITNEMMAKAFVFHFISSLHSEIEDYVLNSKKYTLIKKRYYEFYHSALRNVTQKKYTFNLKKYKDIQLNDLELMADKRFLHQIKSVSEQSDFLVENIIDELEYEIFKESYDDKDSLEKIYNLETSVHSKYRIIKGDPKIKNNYDLYYRTIDSNYSSEILEMDSSAKVGCCNYLTGSKADLENIIEWDVYDEW